MHLSWVILKLRLSKACSVKLLVYRSMSWQMLNTSNIIFFWSQAPCSCWHRFLSPVYMIWMDVWQLQVLCVCSALPSLLGLSVSHWCGASRSMCGTFISALLPRKALLCSGHSAVGGCLVQTLLSGFQFLQLENVSVLVYTGFHVKCFPAPFLV